MLYNPEERYKNRKYLDFNCSLKLLKIRGSLSLIISQPDIYIKDKISEELFDTLNKFAEIRKLDRAIFLRNFDLFPDVKNLLNLELKYGDGLKYEDLHGAPKRNRKRIKKSIGIINGSQNLSETRT